MITDENSKRLRVARTRESGNVLAVVYITLIPVVGIISAFFMRSSNELRMHESRKDEVRAIHKALSAIELARNEVLNSTYTSGNNDRLQAALLQTSLSSLRPDPARPGHYMAFDLTNGARVPFTDPLGLSPNTRPFRLLRTVDLEDDRVGELDDAQDKVAIYAVNLTGLWHMIEARATVNGTSRTARVLVRERDPFTRYGIFIDQHYQGISDRPKGDIHTNRKLQIFFPGAVFDDYVSARDGLEWMNGATLANTTFNGGYKAPSAAIPMPDVNDIAKIRPHATGPYYVSSVYKDVEVILKRDRVEIKARPVAGGGRITLHDGSLPPSGVIYVEGNVAKLEGELDGRLTVATASAAGVTITADIRYVDSSLEPAMINPNSATAYAPNPHYEGTSSLGIVSLGPVLYDRNVSNFLEVNAAIFSSQGNVGLPGLGFTADGRFCTAWDPSFKKKVLNVLGSTIADKRWVGTVVNGAGTLLSGFEGGNIHYDRQLLNNPPPHFLEIDRPLFKGVEIVENVVDL